MGLRIRPASALSVILAIAFALELLAVLSVPVTRSITLCTYGNIQFGVFGYCDTSTDKCSSIGIGYTNMASIEGFSLPSNARHTLASLLIVHVAAAGLTLILLVLTLFAHLHSAAHSSRYLLLVLILSLPCFLLSLLAFLVDILLFIPHLDWGGWIVLGATVLIAIYSVLLCIMRRTISSRKALKNRMNNSELQSLHNTSFQNIPEGGIIYGGEDIPKVNHVSDFTELKFDPVVRETSLNEYSDSGRNQNPHLQNMEANYSTTDYYNPPQTGNRYDNYRQETPPSSQEYRSTGNVDQSAPKVPFDYSQSNYSNYEDYPSHTPNSSLAPSAVAAATAAAGTVGGTTVSLSSGPQRRAELEKYPSSGIVPAGTYENVVDDSSNVKDSYSVFGDNVVPVPQIHNPEAIQNFSKETEAYEYQPSHTLPPMPVAAVHQRATPRQRAINPRSTQQEYPHDTQPLFNSYDSTEAPSDLPSNSAAPKSKSYHDNYTKSYTGDQGVYNPPTAQWRQNYPVTSQNSANQQYPSELQSKIGTSNKPLYSPQAQSRSHHALRQQYLDDDEEVYQPQYISPPDSNRNASGMSKQQEPPVLDKSHLQVANSKHSAPNLETSVSPAISDSSHFTSISQREPNIKYFQQESTPQKIASERTDFVLASNPDFQLPSTKARAGLHKQLGRPSNNKRYPAASSLDAGFGHLDGPYGASRGT